MFSSILEGCWNLVLDWDCYVKLFHLSLPYKAKNRLPYLSGFLNYLDLTVSCGVLQNQACPRRLCFRIPHLLQSATQEKQNARQKYEEEGPVGPRLQSSIAKGITQLDWVSRISLTSSWLNQLSAGHHVRISRVRHLWGPRLSAKDEYTVGPHKEKTTGTIWGNEDFTWELDDNVDQSEELNSGAKSLSIWLVVHVVR